MPPNSRHRAAPASNIRGIAWTVLAVGLLASIDMLVKFTHAEGVPAMEIVFFRNFFGFLFLAPLLIRAGTTLRSSRQAYMIARGLIHGLAMLGWFTAVTLIPLAEATALSFAVPVFATMGAIIFLRERSRLMRWIPIITGIIGVTVILRPGIEAISLGALLVIGSAVTTAISKLMTKSLARTETATTIVIHLNLTLAIATLLPALLVWSTPSLKALALMAAMGVVGTTAHVCWTHAYRIGEVTAVEPANFFRLIWAAGYGFFLFAEVPAVATWIGAAIILLGTVALIRAEARAG